LRIMSQLIFLTGPVRSGKSRRAVELARAWGNDVVFVATYRPPANIDVEMDDRVRRHRAERPGWRTLEAPDDIATALSALNPPPSGVVIDCLTLWTSDRFDRSDEEILTAWDAQINYLRNTPWPVVIVSNEIGWTPVPTDAGLRRFRDLVGTLGQRTAAAAHEAWLMVAGCPVKLK
jgi:adenosyl cobinamide kinase/adenosyl cobinamide phosphate guanylyltransferase